MEVVENLIAKRRKQDQQRYTFAHNMRYEVRLPTTTNIKKDKID